MTLGSDLIPFWTFSPFKRPARAFRPPGDKLATHRSQEEIWQGQGVARVLPWTESGQHTSETFFAFLFFLKIHTRVKKPHFTAILFILSPASFFSGRLIRPRPSLQTIITDKMRWGKQLHDLAGTLTLLPRTLHLISLPHFIKFASIVKSGGGKLNY